MLEELTQQAITALTSSGTPAPAVTIYAPMHKAGSPPNMTEDQIRLKNLVTEAIKKLPDNPDLAHSLEEFLDGVSREQAFWEAQSSGLLLCAHPGELHVFRLPVDTDEYVVVGDYFHLTPILALLHDDQDFYVLTVTQHDPKLFKGNFFGLHDTAVDLPDSVRSALRIDESGPKSEQSRSAGGRNMVGSGSYNGRGGVNNSRDNDRLHFFRLVDNIVCQKIGRSLPLILAGVESEVAEYRHTSKHPYILQGTIAGSFPGAQPHELAAPAQAIVRQELITARHTEALEAYGRLTGTHPERVTDDIPKITQAASDGKVATLLVTLTGSDAAESQDETRVHHITFPKQPELAAAIHTAAAAVERAGGNIINLQATQMPTRSPLAAILRY